MSEMGPASSRDANTTAAHGLVSYHSDATFCLYSSVLLQAILGVEQREEMNLRDRGVAAMRDVILHMEKETGSTWTLRVVASSRPMPL